MNHEELNKARLAEFNKGLEELLTRYNAKIQAVKGVLPGDLSLIINFRNVYTEYGELIHHAFEVEYSDRITKDTLAEGAGGILK